MAALGTKDVVRHDGAYRIHLQGEGHAWAPWYEIVTE
jgi:hypothetical protein